MIPNLPNLGLSTLIPQKGNKCLLLKIRFFYCKGKDILLPNSLGYGRVINKSLDGQNKENPIDFY